TAYLIGRIAPVRLTPGHDDPKEADSEEAATDVGDAVDAEESRGVPVTAVDESGAGADEDTVEDEPQRRGLMIPASMGLRCQIPDDLDSFSPPVSWSYIGGPSRSSNEWIAAATTWPTSRSP
ncbi:MAG: hypothetical protein LC808_08110, partial [Actinobacteria bacterium]|nr:hypothetical protein [Actinomycetota bacterium]